MKFKLHRQTRAPLLFHLLCLTLWLAFSTEADELDHWIWRNPRPFCSQVNSVAHGGGLWVVGANAGMLATSPDAVEWDLASLGPSTNAFISTVAYGNGRFVVGSSRGLYFSYDAHCWLRITNPVVSNMNDLASGNGFFVGVNGNDATVWRSSNGSNWTSQAIGSGHHERTCFANNRFFILGSDSTYANFQLYTSPDGATWTGPAALGTNRIQKVVYGNGLYVSFNSVIVGNSASSQFRTSADGTTWTAPPVLTNHYIGDIVFANGQFVAVDQFARVLLSSDGVYWSEQSVPELFAAGKVVWDGTQFVVSGLASTIVASTNAVNWTRRTTGPQNSLVGIIYTNGLYVAVGGKVVPGGGDAYSKSTVVTSINGRDWTEHDSGTSNSLIAVAFGNGSYVAVGAGGGITTSADAMSWNTAASPDTNVLYSVAYGAGKFVAVGGGGTRATILSSTEGLNWIAQANAINYSPLNGIIFAQNQFVAVGQTNALKNAATLTSPDGLTWTARTSATNTLRAITWANGLYAAVGDRGTIVISPDGVTWSNQSITAVISLRCVAYGGGSFVTVGSPPSLMTSTNGTNWTYRPVFTAVSTSPMYGIVYDGDTFVISGYTGQILQTVPFHPGTPAITLRFRQTDRALLSFTGPETHGYEIQSSDTLPPVWQTLNMATNLSATTTIPDNTATNSSMRLYRVRLLD